jgi:hypothetical protein
MYADDVVLYSPSRESISKALSALHSWTLNNSLHVNTSKTVVMKFRKGGKLAKADTFYYGDSKFEMVNSLEYLGVTFQTKGGFSKHVLSKVNKCAVASCAIKNIPQLSLSAALQLFKIKILPIAAYAISAFWSDLTSKNF